MIDWPAFAPIALTGLCLLGGLSAAYVLFVVVPSLFEAMDDLVSEVESD